MMIIKVLLSKGGNAKLLHQQNQPGNAWSIFLLLVLLLLGSPRSYERRLDILSSAIDATSISLRALSSGMVTLQTGMKQVSLSLSPESTEATFDWGEKDNTTEIQERWKPDFEQSDSNPIIATNLSITQ